jgi:hypothetical protein
VPRQACGIAKRNLDEKTFTPAAQSGHTCRTRRSDLEKTYGYGDGPGADDREFLVEDVLYRSKTEGQATPARVARTRHKLDDEGRPIELTDPLSRLTKLKWSDAENAVTEVEEASGSGDASVIKLDYDATNHTGVLTKKTEYPKHPDTTGALVTTYTYQFSGGTQHSKVPSLTAGDANGKFVADLTEIAGPKADHGESYELETTNSLYTGNVWKRFDKPGKNGAFAEMTYTEHGELKTEDDPVPSNGKVTYSEHHDTGQPVIAPRVLDGLEVAERVVGVLPGLVVGVHDLPARSARSATRTRSTTGSRRSATAELRVPSRGHGARLRSAA